MCNVAKENTDKEKFDVAIKKHLKHYYWDCLGLYDWKSRIEARKDELARAKLGLKVIEQVASFDISDKKMLDVGCGWGGNVVAAVQMGAVVTGCDVDEDVLEVAGLRAKINGVLPELIQAPAENLPFADNEFDYVQSICVLEHVRDVSKSVNEMVRVLKPGGVGFVQVPNYWLPIEPHYKILFPPKCPRPLAKIYLKLLARPTAFIDTLNYVDVKMIKRLFADAGASVSDIYYEYSSLAGQYYKADRKPSCGSAVKPSALSYNAIVCKVMGRSSLWALKLYEKLFGMNNIYYLFRKN
ncbi:MAG: class I SAM-dependent methyltransferase [Anaerohalosphaeraceae bacterium]|nr:class I SAM-dependent methyltransferase [Anaerohalosphaeraceae bacterium]